MGYKIPQQYKEHFCFCGKKLKYSTNKQLNFVLAMHKTSNKHRHFTSWPLHANLDPLPDLEWPKDLVLDNKRFAENLRRSLENG